MLKKIFFSYHWYNNILLVVYLGLVFKIKPEYFSYLPVSELTNRVAVSFRVKPFVLEDLLFQD